MIITKIQGGIGNQLFQYAAGKQLAISNNTELHLDTSWYDSIDPKYRKFELEKFNISAKIASKNESSKFKYSFLNRWKMIIQGKHRWEEKHFHFDSKRQRAKNNTYLSGYWQSEKYFARITDILKKEFTLKKPLPKELDSLLVSIRTSNSVSVHIRRGDYLSPQFHGIYTSCDSEYYKSALSFIKTSVDSPRFFIFSDDIMWAKTLYFPENTTFITSDFGLQNYEELVIMSECKHNITANSTFSWWGAWLNKNPQKIVITPEKWFLDKNKDEADLIPPTWKKLPVKI